MTWSTRTAEIAASAVIGLVLAGSALFVAEATGRLLVAGGAALLLALAARDLAQRPRLTAGPGGVDVRLLTGGVHLPWTRLQVHVRESRRLGLRVRTLELDTAAGPDDDEGELVVLGRRDLGADPAAVAAHLERLDPRSG
ncbi:PH domain-containing protein [Candidatus Blastococcus massiliensis]|uniref:PH domain-containing protein n=1 Tax=Candidatus Blastococcus massiliensis TaxID=1470358 RepID=UPI0004BC81D7|nr:PH domain-containing protein [Candidatus Blastococcus massiliensis]